ncbi:MAG: hypothetical protein U1F43_19250 [Myxococcota bacterium]
MTPPAGEVPANLPAFTFTYRGPFLREPPDDPVRVTERKADGSESDLPVTLDGSPQGGTVTFGRALVEGATYHVAIAGADGNGDVLWYERDLVAGPAAPFPTTLGRIRVGGEHDKTADVWTVSGSCTSEADITARNVTLELSAEAEPWKRALSLSWSHTTSRRSQFVDFLPDADRWQYGVERMAYHVCSADDPGVDPGDPSGHFTISVTASIPGAPAIPALSVGTSLDCGCGVAAGGPPAGLVAALLLLARRRSIRQRS